MKPQFPALILAVLLFPLPVQGESLFPPGERITYRRVIGKNGEDVTVQEISRGEKNGSEFVRILYKTGDNETDTLLDPARMLPVEQKRILSSEDGMVVQRKWELIVPPLREEGRIPLIEVTDLFYLLRAYPFDAPEEMTLQFMNGGGQEMAFRVLYSGEERLRIMGKQTEAYKLELKADLPGGMGLFSGMVPRTYFWFSKEEPHWLLKFSGSQGMGSENSVLLEMISRNTD